MTPISADTAQPQAAALAERLLAAVRAPWLADFRQQLQRCSGTRLDDWVDDLIVPERDLDAAAPAAAGFVAAADGAWRQPLARLPALWPDSAGARGLVLRVDSVEAFAAVHGLDAASIEGSYGAAVRRLSVAADGAGSVWAVERHGVQGLRVAGTVPEFWVVDGWWRALAARPRFVDDPEGLLRLLTAAIRDLGHDRVASLFFDTERHYWMGRNRAARLQKARQDALGLGWANHDHHVYRSSRAALPGALAVFSLLGLRHRETVMADEAGCAALVMDQPACDVVVVIEVDVMPGESRAELLAGPRASGGRPGSAGLWCALHGESLFTAGLHRLAIAADLAAAPAQLAALGETVTAAGLDAGHLRQVATAAERWPVSPGHVDRALQAGWIDDAGAAELGQAGAEGSSLEFVERHHGFRGFVAAAGPRSGVPAR